MESTKRWRRMVAPTLLFAGLAVLGCSSPEDTAPEAPAAESAAGRLRGPTSRFVEFEGGRVHYLDSGSGPPTLALVHGWASDHRVWRFQIDSLSSRARLLAIDLPGHGRSDPVETAFSMDLFARATAAVLDDAGVAAAVLVGHSNGTPAVRQFYRLYPERTLGLVTIDGPLKQMFDLAMLEGVTAQLGEELYSDFVAASVDGMPGPGLGDELRSEIRAMALEQPHAAVLGGFLAATETSIWAPDPIAAPLLVVNAEQPAWNEEYVAFVRKLAPHVDYQLLEDTSHFLMLERPDVLDRLLLEFLEREHLL